MKRKMVKQTTRIIPAQTADIMMMRMWEFFHASFLLSSGMSAVLKVFIQIHLNQEPP